MAATAPSRADAEVRDRLRHDTPFYAQTVLRIVNKAGEIVPLVPRPAQERFDAALEGQREAGKPMRIICLKARQLGFSTWTQAKIVQRVTQEPNHRAITVAQDNNTAGSLFTMAETMHAYLPDDPEWGLKPVIRNRRRQRELLFGEPSSRAREAGDLGLNSLMKVDTAREVTAQRGITYRSLHASEVAWWGDAKAKLTGLLQTVPDDPGTLIVLESTANGYDDFKDLWDKAEDGQNDYIPFFAAWHEDPTYRRRFLTEGEREEFTVGDGPYGEDEPMLVERFGLELEQLAWRRWAIENKCQGDLRIFRQEFPSFAAEAFLATGRQVFAPEHTSRLVERVREIEPVASGRLVPEELVTRRLRAGSIEIPRELRFEEVPAAPHRSLWTVWAFPDPGRDALPADPEADPSELAARPAGRYIVAVDPAGDEEDDDGNTAFHAIEVIDHRTGEQVAEWAARTDPDLVAVEAYKAAVFYNDAWLVVEKTGGYGVSMNRKIAVDLAYPRVYRRRRLETRLDRSEERLGWETNRTSKTLIEDGAKELLREGQDGIRSVALAQQFTWYVRHDGGRTGPQHGKFSDRLMAWMIAQQVRAEKPVPKDRAERSTTSTARTGTRGMRRRR